MTLAEIEVAAAGAYEKNEQLLKDVKGYSDELLQKNPNSWQGHKLAGDLAFINVKKEFVNQHMIEARKSLATAVTEYRASLASKGDEYSTRIALGRALELSGETGEAETIFNGLTNKEKQNTTGYMDLYRLYLAERKLGDAENLLKRAIQNNPKMPAASGTRAFLSGHQQAGRPAEAAERDEGRFEIVSRRVYAGRRLLHAANQFDEAIKQYEEGVKKDPDKKLGYMKHEVEVYVRSNRMQLATAKNDEILKIDSKDPEARGLKATLSLDKGEYSSATTELQSVVTARPGNYVAHFNLGRAYLGKGDIEQARQEFDKAVQLRPDYVMARLAQTQIALAAGRHRGPRFTMPTIS